MTDETPESKPPGGETGKKAPWKLGRLDKVSRVRKEMARVYRGREVSDRLSAFADGPNRASLDSEAHAHS
jgi:hypothetical protein